MSELDAFLEEQREETRAIIAELLEDGSDPDAQYTIELTDAEELEVEGGQVVLCCDIISECGLTAEHIDAQVEQLARLAEKMDVDYDGWGTYFEDPDAEDEDDEDDDDADEAPLH